MRSGRLRHLVTIQNVLTQSTDSSGAVTENWDGDELADEPAAVEPLRGQELFAAQAVQSRATTKITIRYSDDVTVTTKSRVLFEDEVYNVLEVIDRDKRHVHLELLCETGAGPNA